MEINGQLGKLTPCCPQNPEPMATKVGVGDDDGDIHQLADLKHRISQKMILLCSTVTFR